MIRQIQRINLSIASPLEIEHTARQLTAVREDFLNTGSLDLWTPRPLILDSWQRCRLLRVNPSQRYAPLAISREAQLMQLREENALLIQAAHPVMQRLTHFLTDSGYVTVLSDAHGCLLDVLGDTTIRRRLARIDFVPGGNWSEAAAGTNAIGTALTDGHMVQLMGAEHYCDGWQDLTCTAAPIRHPLTNQIIGILDVTGNYRLIRSFLTNFLATAVLEIKQRLHLLLSSHYQSEWQRRYYSPPDRFVDGAIRGIGRVASQIEIDTMSEIPYPEPSNVPIRGQSPADEIQLRLNLQERRAQDAEALAAAAGAISSSLDLQTTLEKVVEQIAHLLQAERAGIHLFDEENGTISIRASTTQLPFRLEKPDVISALLKDEQTVSLIRDRGEPVVIDDILISAFLAVKSIKQTGIRSIILLPLVTARGISGFITVSSCIPYRWSVEDIRLGLAFATQSATAIENARLFETLQQHNRHIEALNAIAHILSILPDPSQHLDLVLQRTIEIIAVDAGMILLLDHDQDQMTLAAHHKLSQNIALNLDAIP